MPMPPVQQYDAEGDEDLMCTTKWQLYFHGKDAKAEAISLMSQGM